MFSKTSYTFFFLKMQSDWRVVTMIKLIKARALTFSSKTSLFSKSQISNTTIIYFWKTEFYLFLQRETFQKSEAK